MTKQEINTLKANIELALDEGLDIETYVKEVKDKRKNDRLAKSRLKVAEAFLDYIDLVAPDSIIDPDNFVQHLVKEMEAGEKISEKLENQRTFAKNKSESDLDKILKKIKGLG